MKNIWTHTERLILREDAIGRKAVVLVLRILARTATNWYAKTFITGL
jgi:hypothetical protein